MPKGYALHIAANGYCCIKTPSMLKRWRLSLLLTFRYRFRRQGRRILAWDDAIHPDFVRANLRILSSWDNWFGYSLLADDPETDAFLKTFYDRHCAESPLPR